MSDRQRQRAEGEQQQQEERRYSRDELLANPRRAGARTRHEVAGALHGGTREELTEAQARKAVEDFRRHRDETPREGTGE